MKVQYQSTSEFEGTDSYIKIKFWFISCTERSKNSDFTNVKSLKENLSFSLNWDIRATTRKISKSDLNITTALIPEDSRIVCRKEQVRKNIFENLMSTEQMVHLSF